MFVLQLGQLMSTLLNDPAFVLFAACKKQLKAEQADQKELQQSSAAAELDMAIEEADQKLASTRKEVAAGEAR